MNARTILLCIMITCLGDSAMSQQRTSCPASARGELDSGSTIQSRSDSTLTVSTGENLLAAMDTSGADGVESPDASIPAIPESSWRREGLEGPELTDELAREYPREHDHERSARNGAWALGEHLVFQIKYGFYKAGTATMSVVGEEFVNGGICHHIVTTAESNDFISAFYKVRDRVSSYIDKRGIYSRRFEKHLREGNYNSDRTVDFYHERLLALNTNKKYAVVEIKPFIHDILSALYYIRTEDIKVGNTLILDVYADGKVYPLNVIVHGREKVKVPAGTFSCYKVEPVLRSEGLFKQKGKLTVWLTADEAKMPVKMTSKILIGSIGSLLESYRPGHVQ
jgi:hypothetical protein